MGDKKRESGKILVVRAQVPKTEQETLVPCPACNGTGRRLVHTPVSHQYREIGCHWCDGAGHVPRAIIRVFRRWIRLRAWNVARGACPED